MVIRMDMESVDMLGRDDGVTRVVNLRRRGCEVYIGRGPGGTHMMNTDPRERGWLGNPYIVNNEDERIDAVLNFLDDFVDKLKSDEEFYNEVKKIEGRNLGCFCAPKLCHGDVIIKFIEDGYDGLDEMRDKLRKEGVGDEDSSID